MNRIQKILIAGVLWNILVLGGAMAWSGAKKVTQPNTTHLNHWLTTFKLEAPELYCALYATGSGANEARQVAEDLADYKLLHKEDEPATWTAYLVSFKGSASQDGQQYLELYRDCFTKFYSLAE
jgi:hypothetical protein